VAAHFLFQDCCNQLQRLGVSGGWSGAALGAVTADFEAGDDYVEAAVALDLSLQSVEEITLEFRDLAAAQAGHVDVVTLRAALVKMFFSLHVHEIEFIDQAVPLEQTEGAVDGDAVDVGIEAAGVAQDLAGVEVLFGGFDHAQDGAALMRHAEAAGHQFGLQASGGFGLG
jgi:hypothetical protein